MNKVITILLIMVGVLMVLLFPSFHLEGGNVVLFLIAVFVLGFMSGGFSNLDNIVRTNGELQFYTREVAKIKGDLRATRNEYIELVEKHEKLTLEKDELRLDAIRNFDGIFQELKRLKNEEG